MKQKKKQSRKKPSGKSPKKENKTGNIFYNRGRYGPKATEKERETWTDEQKMDYEDGVLDALDALIDKML